MLIKFPNITRISNIVEIIRKKSKCWYLTFFILLTIIPILLVGCQLFIISGINSGTITSNEIFNYYLNTTHPTPSSFFISNYIHQQNNLTHLFDNIQVYLVIILLILILESIILPIFCQINKDEKIFYDSLKLYFVIFPFSISGMSMLIMPFLNQPNASGFSGIISAFIGYFWFLIYYCLINHRDYLLWNRRKKILMNIIFVMSLTFPVIVMVFLYFQFNDNIAGHITGFILGMLAFYCMFLSEKKYVDKITISIFFSLIIFLTSTLWLFIH